ncbi:hypothetical protein PMAYCL1PPCAC_25734, partial [Pristionchus mayeri]
MTGIYVSHELSERLNIFCLILFCVSQAASCLVFFCFYKVPTSHEKLLRRYLLAVQVIAVAYDIHFDVLFLSHPIFPVHGGYCDGLLCFKELHGILVLMIGNIGVAIIMCLVRRHQTILLPYSPLKFEMRSIWSLHGIMGVVFSIPGASAVFIPVD